MLYLIVVILWTLLLLQQYRKSPQWLHRHLTLLFFWAQLWLKTVCVCVWGGMQQIALVLIHTVPLHHVAKMTSFTCAWKIWKIQDIFKAAGWSLWSYQLSNWWSWTVVQLGFICVPQRHGFIMVRCFCRGSHTCLTERRTNWFSLWQWTVWWNDWWKSERMETYGCSCFPPELSQKQTRLISGLVRLQDYWPIPVTVLLFPVGRKMFQLQGCWRRNWILVSSPHLPHTVCLLPSRQSHHSCPEMFQTQPGGAEFTLSLMGDTDNAEWHKVLSCWTPVHPSALSTSSHSVIYPGVMG